MLVRFGVVLPARMTEGGGVLLVAGSRPELGQWDPQRAVPMKPARPTAPLPAREPALWLAEVVLPDEDAPIPFWYKFLRRQGGDLLWEGNGRAGARQLGPRGRARAPRAARRRLGGAAAFAPPALAGGRGGPRGAGAGPGGGVAAGGGRRPRAPPLSPRRGAGPGAAGSRQPAGAGAAARRVGAGRAQPGSSGVGREGRLFGGRAAVGALLLEGSLASLAAPTAPPLARGPGAVFPSNRPYPELDAVGCRRRRRRPPPTRGGPELRLQIEPPRLS